MLLSVIFHCIIFGKHQKNVNDVFSRGIEAVAVRASVPIGSGGLFGCKDAIQRRMQQCEFTKMCRA